MNIANGFFRDDRDYSHILISLLDLESQLFAITSLLGRNNRAEAEAVARIKTLEDWAKGTNGMENQHAIDQWVDELHYSVYTGAAASMAAIGMFAPLLESIFTEAFRTLGALYAKSGTPVPAHKRWDRHNPEGFDRWNPQIYFGSRGPRSDIFLGISQLSEATGLGKFLEPSDYQLLEALFFYRNRMFHMGFEWPMESRKSFLSQIEKKGWDEYFSRSTTGGEPWLIYLSDATINWLSVFVEQLVTKIGHFARAMPDDLLLDRSSTAPPSYLAKME